jgi:histidine kinase
MPITVVGTLSHPSDTNKMASAGDIAVMRPSEQPFLKELLERGSSWSRVEFAREEMPPLKDVQMVTIVAAHETPAISQEGFLSAMKEMKSPEPMKRGDSENSTESRTSIDSTAELSSFGESSLSNYLSTGRLYGREQEEEFLRSAFNRIVIHKAPRPSSFVLISGGSGSGKTRLAESLRSHVASVGGYFCSGKYDQHQDDPFEPLCAAFNDYVMQLLEEDDVTIRAARRRIHAAVEKDLYSLANMIPPLRRLMEDELIRMDSGNVECAHCNQEKGRSMFAMNKLMRAIASPERPLVMMLDDIQWASSCPLQKWRGMIQDDMNEGIMFIGVCRDDVAPTSPLSIFLRDLEELDHVDISNLPVKSLEKPHIEEMINDLFFMPAEQSESLATFVNQNSGGNAYFVVESLKMLQLDSTVLNYNANEKSWEFNSDVCCQSSYVCPLDFMERKLRSLPRDCQKVIMAASCLGSNISERLLEVALQEPVGDRFQMLLQKGKLSFNEARKTYSFKHNAVQSACYNLISEELKPAFHLEIGLRLWKHLTEEELGQNIFLVLNQLKQGVTLMRKQADRYEVATLCITAAEKAAAQYAFPTASSYLRFAFVLLGQDHWKESYELSLVLYNYAAEVEFAQGDSDRVDFLIDEVLKNARHTEDKFRAYTTKIYVLGVRGKAEDSVDLGISCLKSLGVNITPQCHKVHLTWSWSRVAIKLRGKSDQMLKRLPPMQDTEKLAAMQILNMLFLNTHISKKELFPFVVLKMMKLTLFHGVSAFSSVAFAGYGSLLCYSGKVEEGMRFGRLALELVEELNAQSYYARVGAFVWGTIFVHSRPFVDSLEHLKNGHRLGLQTGDIEFAMLNAHLHMMFRIDSGHYRISSMLDQLTEFKDLTALHGHTNQVCLLWIVIVIFVAASILNLLFSCSLVRWIY